MPTVRDILQRKGSQVATIHPDATVYDAALTMNEQKIGSLVVVHEGRLVGIFTERDVLQRVVGQRRDAAATLVREVMTPEVACCQLHTSLDEARGVMKNRRIRHLPVVNEVNQLLGLVSIGDLNAHETNSQEQTIHLLREYLYGPG
jgi:CBS domain-containing protein